MQLQLTAQLIDTVLVLDRSGRSVSGEESDFFRTSCMGFWT